MVIALVQKRDGTTAIKYDLKKFNEEIDRIVKCKEAIKKMLRE